MADLSDRAFPLLEVRDVTKTFPGVTALSHVNFTLNPGEIHAVVGENGAGKSTLMMILSGVYQPDSGEILLDGQPVRIMNPSHAQSLGITTVYQELSLVPGISVAENVFLNRAPTGPLGLIDWQTLQEATRRLLESLGMDVDPSALVKDLLPSQQQMVEIAKAFSLHVRVVLLDEPTSSLSRDEVDRLFTLLRALRQRGIGIVIITHRVAEVFDLADRITVLRDGRVVGTWRAVETNPDHLVVSMVGREVKEAGHRTGLKLESVVMEARKISTPGLSEVSFTLHPGEILGVAGLGGSGRNELGRVLFGLQRLTGGELRMDGQPLKLTGPLDAIKRGIGYIPPDRKTSGLFMRMAIRDNIVAGSLGAISRWGLVRNELGDRLSEHYRTQLSIRSRSIFQPVSTLSGGTQQKVVVARWLAKRPRVLIVDDPTIGIDTGAKAEIHQLLADLSARGTAIVLISSELLELFTLSHRIMVLRGGRVVGQLTPVEFSDERVMVLAAGGSATGTQGMVYEHD